MSGKEQEARTLASAYLGKRFRILEKNGVLSSTVMNTWTQRPISERF